MPWRISSAMSERFEFVMLASQENANIRALCRRFGISSRTAYKWLARYELEGAAGVRRSLTPAAPFTYANTTQDDEASGRATAAISRMGRTEIRATPP